MSAMGDRLDTLSRRGVLRGAAGMGMLATRGWWPAGIGASRRSTGRWQPAYRSTPLADVPQGVFDNAVAVNDAGVVAGWSATEADGISEAVIWTAPDAFTVLPSLGGGTAEARAINNEGLVVGVATTASGDMRPVMWIDGVPTDLGTLGGPRGMAHGINDRGQVVGIAETREGTVHPFRWDDGEMLDLDRWRGRIEVEGISRAEMDAIMAMLGAVVPLDINNDGVVVGSAGSPIAFEHAVVWADGEMIDLGTLGGSWSTARAINDAGQVVGWSRLTPDDPEEVGPPEEGGHAFLWEGGALIDLGAPDADGWCGATDINARGQIAMTGSTWVQRSAALLWEDGVFTQLARYGGANGINAAGVVVGGTEAPEGKGAGAAMMWEPE